MSRPLAGYIGYDAEPSLTAAPGIWTLREAEFYKRKAQWPVPFAPDVLTGLQAWYDASDASTVTESSGSVSQIDDKSGNDYHLTQATAGLKPTYETAVQNGLNVITAINDLTYRQTLESSNASLAAIGNGSFTVVTVARMNTVGGSTGRADSFSWGSGGFSAAFVRFNNDINDFRLFFRDDSNNRVDQNSADNFWSADQWYVMITTVDGNAITVYQDNSQVVTGDKTGLNINVKNYQMMRPQDANGSISVGEQVIYNSALSTADRTLLHDYLVAKWGIT